MHLVTALVLSRPNQDTTLTFSCNPTAPTELYTLSLHDALPIWAGIPFRPQSQIQSEQKSVDGLAADLGEERFGEAFEKLDRKSTRLNSSHQIISYAVFCLKKKTT